MYYFARILNGFFGMGEVIDVRMLENHGLYKFQRKKKLFGHTWWEFIPYLMSELETSDRATADKWMKGFRETIERDSSEWKIVEDK